jgi:VIT1/CCC1 family predicted Fe2+/Mn2+ transporter
MTRICGAARGRGAVLCGLPLKSARYFRGVGAASVGFRVLMDAILAVSGRRRLSMVTAKSTDTRLCRNGHQPSDRRQCPTITVCRTSAVLPIVLGFLYLLAPRLPAPHRLDGAYAVIVAAIIALAAAFAVYASLAGILG